MVKSHGSIRKGRHILKYAKSPNKYHFAKKQLEQYSAGDRIVIIINSRSKKGMPHITHHGVHGIVLKVYKKGLYTRLINKKSLIINKIHVKKL